MSSSSSNAMMIYDFFHEAISGGEYGICDRVLSTIEVENMEAVDALAILTITSASKGLLANRESFYNKVRERLLASRDARVVERMLVGLE